MEREIKVGVPVSDHFPVFEDDGYTKHPGLVSTDFDVTVYQNSVPIVLPVSIVEIGSSGEYEIGFTPPSEAVYDVEILAYYNSDIFRGGYSALTETTAEWFSSILSQCEKIDLVPTIGPHSVTSGSLMDRMMNKGVTKDYNQGTDSLEALRDRLG
jgi:hypothetical protein